MKNTRSLIDVAAAFATTDACIRYLEAMRWPNGVRCPQCGGVRVSKFVTNETMRELPNGKTRRVPARHLYTCLEPTCTFQFSATAGTIFHDSHLSLEKWFMAVALMVNAKKGLSAKQMERDLGVSYRTAWYLCHRIRKAMEEGNPGLLTGTVECDETYVGGRYDQRRKRAAWQKQPVFGVVQRGSEGQCSKARAFPIRTNSAMVLTGAVKGNVDVKADLLVTDQYIGYKSLGKTYRHETVNHIKLEYVRSGDIHTNSVENFWSLFKRGLIGSFHKVSVKHLRRYLNEFTFRFSNRDAKDLFALVMLNLVIVSGIKYAELISQEEPDAMQPLKPIDLSWE